jgi:putative flippase GtrA
MLIIIGVERLFHFDVIICNFIALGISGLLNFLLGEKWVFIMKKKTSSQNKETDN